jgi:hypothetical protein
MHDVAVYIGRFRPYHLGRHATVMLVRSVLLFALPMRITASSACFSALVTVFENGEILKEWTFDECRARDMATRVGPA